MAVHADREHAQWSASSTDRNWNCSGAMALTMDMPESTNEAADWGTCAHQIAEKCLRDDVDAVSFIGTTEKGKKHEFEIDEEMADTAQVYVDYCRACRDGYKAATGKNALVFVEERFSLASLNPPFEAGGTADFVIIYPEWKMLEVVDLKGGRGVVVEVKGNPQTRTYGLGAMLKHPTAKIDKIKVTIVQPRAGHKDGRTRSEEFHVADLAEWTTDLMAAMQRSYTALSNRKHFGKDVEMPNGETHTVTEAWWNSAYLNAGSHCKFCKAAGFCPALEQKALDAAGVWFDDLDQPRLSNSPDAMSPEKLAATLDMLDMIGEWMNAVRAYAHSQAESGIELPGYQLVEKIGNRAWALPETSIIAALENECGLTKDQIFADPKLKSPAQIEKTLGKRKAKITPWVERPIRGTNLVAVTKTTRPAATPSVRKHLEDLDAPKPNPFD